MPRALSWLVPLLLLASGGAHARGEPAALEIARAAEARLDGELAIEATTALLDVSGPIWRGATWELSWSSATLFLSTQREPDAGPVTSQVGVKPWPPEERTVALGPGHLASLRCTRLPCDAIVLAEPDLDGALAATGGVSGALAPTREGRVYWAGMGQDATGERPEDASGFLRELPPGVLLLGGADDALALDGAFTGRGALRVFFDGVHGEIVLGDERRPFWTGNGTEEGLAGLPAGRSFVRQYAVLVLQDARLSLAAEHGALLGFAQADARFAGALRARVEEGAVVSGGRSTPASGEALLAEGVFAGALRGIAAGDALVGAAPAALALSWRGDATHVSLGAAQLVHAPGYAKQALWLSLFLLFASGALFASYSRHARDDLLAEPKRRALYGALASGEPHAVPRLAEALGLTAAAVTYHLRRMETAGLVRMVREGRTRVAFVGPAPREPRAALALASTTRRRIAEAVGRQPGLTQGDLVRELGLSQRLVAYHLAWLRRAGLVQVEPGRPARYRLEGAAQAMLAG